MMFQIFILIFFQIAFLDSLFSLDYCTTKGEEVEYSSVKNGAYQMLESNPNLILGSSKIFEYHNDQVCLSEIFRKFSLELLKLQKISEEENYLSNFSIKKLNDFFQKNFLRPQGVDRNSLVPIKGNRNLFPYFKKLGFMSDGSTAEKFEVDHVLCFGAYALCMYHRFDHDLSHLYFNNLTTEKIYVLVSNRALEPSEKIVLQRLFPSYSSDKINKMMTESDAAKFIFSQLLKDYPIPGAENKITFLESCKVGASFNGKDGYRPTTKSCLEVYLKEIASISTPLSIYSSVEYPYLRIGDQLRWMIISNNNQANLEQLSLRGNQYTFVSRNRIANESRESLFLDEIARHIYDTYSKLNYLDNLNKH